MWLLMSLHLLAKPSLGSDAEAIPNQQRADQQLRIHRGTTCVAVEVCEMRMDATQVDEEVNRSKQMILRDMVLQRELVEQCYLRFLPRSHHQPTPPYRRN